MEGVTILASEEVVTKTAASGSWFVIPFAIITIGLAILGLWLWLSHRCDGMVVPVLIINGILLGTLMGTLFFAIGQRPVEYETQYKVIIDNNVSMNEFYEHYEVIDQEGKIFTIRGKNNNE